MKKIIIDRTISFYDENNFEIMYMDHSRDECIWFFHSSDVINITPDMELYNALDNFMKQRYVFQNEVLKNYKDDNKLVWYSDCYYDPDDEWSVNSVTCLNIEKKENCFKIWCTRKIDEKLNIKSNSFCISFSPCGNGAYSKNLNNGLTLQDDFVMLVYQIMLLGGKVLKKTNYIK